MNAKYHFANVAPEQPRWEKTPDGFLRCRARVLAAKILQYGQHELGQPLPGVGDPVLTFVPLEALTDPAALRSLEGCPVVAGGHAWLDPENTSLHQVGAVAGTPRLDGDYLVCDLLVTSAATIEAIEAGRLPEISAAYVAELLRRPGLHNGQPYDAVQEGLRFNHIAVIPAGHGRAGMDVKILNIGGTKMSEHFENGRRKALAEIEAMMETHQGPQAGGHFVNATTRQRNPQERLGLAEADLAEGRRLENTGEAFAQAVTAARGRKLRPGECPTALEAHAELQRQLMNGAAASAELARRVKHNRKANLRRLGFPDRRQIAIENMAAALSGDEDRPRRGKALLFLKGDTEES